MNHTSRHLIVLLLLLPVAAVAQAPAEIALTINGRLIESDQPALLSEDALLIRDEVLASDLGLQIQQDKGLWHLRYYEHHWQVRPNERKLIHNDLPGESPAPPLLRGESLYVPVKLLAEGMKLVITQAGRDWGITSPTCNLVQLRQGVHPDRVRYVMDLTGPASYRTYQEPGRLVVEVPMFEERPGLVRLHQFADPLAEQVTESWHEGFLRLVFTHASPEAPQVFTLAEPARIVVDLLREEPQCVVTPKPPPVARPTPGDIWSVANFTGAKGPVRAFVIRFHPRQTNWTLKPRLAGSTIMQRSTVSRIAARNQAYAAINGGFFASQGPPLGMLMVEGEWIKAPLYGRAVLGLSCDGTPQIANVDFSARVEFAGLGMLPIDRLNEGYATPETMVVYTNRWGPVVLGAPDKALVTVNADGVVTAIYPPNIDVYMPKGGFVLSANGRRAETLRTIPQGTAARLCLETKPAWPDLWDAVGGGPVLVQDGKVNVTGAAERFRSDVVHGSRPRSAVGITKPGEILLVAVENPGLTLAELAAVMVKMGAHDAMNLDGGGSTAMVVNGRLLNAPSDGCERAVSNALLVMKR